MKPSRVAILFDSHTPYLAFRVNALQEALKLSGLTDRIELHVILIAADWASYGWGAEDLQQKYGVPVHVLSKEFYGLGFRSFLHPALPRVLAKLLTLYYRLRPKITLVGGYDRPTSLFCRLLSYPLLAKVGVMHDSRFNDAESYSKNIWLELAKSFAVRSYSFFMCSGRECADYTRFLAGARKPVYTEAWNIVDNEGIARAADDASHDEELLGRLGLKAGEPYYFCPARFVAKKNLPFVIAAHSDYARSSQDQNSPPSTLVLCGQGPDKALVQQAISHHSNPGAVKICDWLPYELIPRACRLSSAVVLASHYDQWGMTVNETLSSGTPVLVSNRCGAHELVQNDINGFTFSPTDKAHLSALFLNLHRTPQCVDRLRAACRGSMARFSIRQFIQQYLQMFRDNGLLAHEAGKSIPACD